MAELYKLERDGVTSTLLQRFMKCRRAAELYLEGWVKLKTSDSLAFGTLFHDLLRKLYSHYREERPPLGASKLAAQAEAITDPWLDEYIRRASRELAAPEQIEALERDAAIIHRMVDPYTRFWEEDFRKARWVSLESQFDVQHRGFRLRGKRDGLYKKKDKSIWLLETKTKGRIDEEELLLMLTMDFQCLFYMLATEIESGKRPVGVDYNVIRRPGHEIREGESFAEFADRIRADIDKRPDHFFKRFEVAYDSSDFRWFGRMLAQVLKEFKDWHDGLLPTYPNLASCIGRWNCSYLEACSSRSMTGYVQAGIFRELEE